MKAEFVPYELAVKLKPLEFDEPCLGFYNNRGQLILMAQENESVIATYKNSDVKIGMQYAAPTFSQAFRWFREKYSLFSSILPFQDIEDDIRLCYYYCVINLDECKDEDILCNESSLGASDINFSSPAEAELACLEKLIGILEKRNADMTEHGVYK